MPSAATSPPCTTSQAARGHAFNIGGGIENSMSLLELLQYLEQRLGIKLNYTHLPWRQSDQKFFVADNSKAGEPVRRGRR